MIEDLINLIIDDINRKNKCTESSEEIVDNNDTTNKSIQDKTNNNSRKCKGDF